MLDAKEPEPQTAAERLREAHADWVRKGSLIPPKQAAKVVEAYAKLDDEINALEKRLEVLKLRRNSAIIDLVRVCGRGRLDLGRLGVQIPMAKGDALWMRPEHAATARKVL